MKTATGREKLLIQNRKIIALYQIQPDLMAGKPFSFFPYMSEDCVFRSDRLAEPLTGQAIRNFMIREKCACEGFRPSPWPSMVESTEDGDILLRIRPRFGDETPDGELVQLELNADGKVCQINRFDENRLPYRKFSTCVSLVPVRKIREGEDIRCERDRTEEVFFSSLYYDEMTLIFDILPECPFFDDMEERNMEMSAWVAIMNLWKQINETGDFHLLHDMVFRAQEEYIRKDRGYAGELEELIRTVLQKREPYGRRMQAWMEDWLNHCRKEYDRIWKC